MADGMKIVSDRWMLQSRQIVNWGSYGGWHEFRPSMDDIMPVTLLAGASESGKSTLVDAQISLLYPSGTPTIRRRIPVVRNVTTTPICVA